MMLYLVRHGEALTEEIDPERALSEKGIKDIKEIADSLKMFNPEISLLVHSGKKRAEQTADIFHSRLNLNCPVEVSDRLSPNGPIHFIYDLIVKGEGNLMIVGHLPFLSRLLSKLITGREEDSIVNFKAGSLAVLEYIPHQNWQVVEVLSP